MMAEQVVAHAQQLPRRPRRALVARLASRRAELRQLSLIVLVIVFCTYVGLNFVLRAIDVTLQRSAEAQATALLGDVAQDGRVALDATTLAADRGQYALLSQMLAARGAAVLHLKQTSGGARGGAGPTPARSVVIEAPSGAANERAGARAAGDANGDGDGDGYWAARWLLPRFAATTEVERRLEGPVAGAPLVVRITFDDGGLRGEMRRHAIWIAAIIALMAATAAGLPRVAELQRERDETAARDRVRGLAEHDHLTGLRTRDSFQQGLARDLRGLSNNGKLGLLVLDVRHFKRMVASHGYETADAVLVVLANRLRRVARASDDIARLAGDRFAIAINGIRTANEAEVIAQRMLEAIREPVSYGSCCCELDCAIGIAIAPIDATEAGALMDAADVALERAKADLSRPVRFFEQGMESEISAHRQIAADLYAGIARDEFELHYQPQLDLTTNRVVGYEALVRWRRPGFGLVPPGVFIPIAEETGAIRNIGLWVLKQGCRDAHALPDNARVAINLSGRQLETSGLVASVQDALRASGLPANRLELEITESVLLKDTETTLATLRDLRSLGVQISMDDFGTGYSSLTYLQRFPFDAIKIDKSFVDGVCNATDSLAIIRAVVGLAQALGIRTIAEGVETGDQLAALRHEGCDEVQGYLLAKPKPLAELTPVRVPQHAA